MDGQKCIWLSEDALEQMALEATQAAPDETGGALMGYEVDEELVVTNLIGPGPNAIRTPCSFRPDEAYQLQEIARLYEQSGRMHTYVGDWHSHPTSSPRYSGIDRRALSIIAQNAASRCARPVLVILGHGDPWAAVAWRFYPGRWWPSIKPVRIVRH